MQGFAFCGRDCEIDPEEPVTVRCTNRACGYLGRTTAEFFGDHIFGLTVHHDMFDDVSDGDGRASHFSEQVSDAFEFPDEVGILVFKVFACCPSGTGEAFAGKNLRLGGWQRP